MKKNGHVQTADWLFQWGGANKNLQSTVNQRVLSAGQGKLGKLRLRNGRSQPLRFRQLTDDGRMQVLPARGVVAQPMAGPFTAGRERRPGDDDAASAGGLPGRPGRPHPSSVGCPSPASVRHFSFSRQCHTTISSSHRLVHSWQYIYACSVKSCAVLMRTLGVQSGSPTYVEEFDWTYRASLKPVAYFFFQYLFNMVKVSRTNENKSLHRFHRDYRI